MKFAFQKIRDFVLCKLIEKIKVKSYEVVM